MIPPSTRAWGLRRVAAALSLLGAMLWLAPVATAQSVELRLSPEPYYVSVPVEIEVHSEGFERSPEPQCKAPTPAQGELTLRGISPNIESSVTIINGRMTQTERVRFVCQYQFVSARKGNIVLGPFSVEQNGSGRRTRTVRLAVGDVPLDPRLKLRIRVPDHPVYIGQHVSVDIEWWLQESLSEKIQTFRIRSPLFRREGDFHFVGDELAERGAQSLKIETDQGELPLKAEVTRKTEGGKRYLVLSAHRTLVPVRAGRFELAPAQIDVEEVTRWRRDFFGGRTPAQTRRLLSRDVARVLDVRDPPLRDRPPSFAGAVGRGFTLDVTTDRSVVQRGDPIVLTLRVRGDGNLRVVSLPSLDREGGLSSEQFRLPSGDVTGEWLDDEKRFEVTVRILDEEVREIPALAYSWFDPELNEYQTTWSRPIALSVNPAQIVSAADVVAATPEQDAGETPGELRDPKTGPREAPAFVTTGADLSIERDPSRLLGRRGGARVAPTAAYAGGLLCVAGAFALRRRREADPELKRLRDLYTAKRQTIKKSGGLPRLEAAGEIASAVREVLAATPERGSPELDAFLQSCDNLVYAPSADASSDTGDELARRALALLEGTQESSS